MVRKKEKEKIRGGSEMKREETVDISVPDRDSIIQMQSTRDW